MNRGQNKDFLCCRLKYECNQVVCLQKSWGPPSRFFKGGEAPTIIFGVLVGSTLAINNLKFSLSNSIYFTSAKKMLAGKLYNGLHVSKNAICISNFLENCIFPNTQVKGVVNRLAPLKNLSGPINRFLMG